MMNKVFFSVLAFGLLTLLYVTGCGTPRINPEMREGVPEARSGASQRGTEMDVQWDEDDQDWQDLEDSMVTEEGKAAGEEQRWDSVVYFAFDRSHVGSSQRPKVETVADFLEDNQQYSVLIEGHCDERGSDEYNRALGERRALSVKDYLISLGIADDRIETVSYGEEKPAVQNADTAEEHAKNRRAEFVFKADEN
ncbi:MAG: OmpA family protein [Lentisphaeria bacterium]